MLQLFWIFETAVWQLSNLLLHASDSEEPGVQQYVRSVYKYCHRIGYLCSVHYSEQSSKKERAILEDVTSHSIIDKILSVLPKVSAIFCVNDLIAFRLMNAAGRRGVIIADDLLFVGFDNISYPANDDVDLTSVEQNYDLIGKTCVELLCKQMEEGAGSSICIPTKLKIGKSVAEVKV